MALSRSAGRSFARKARRSGAGLFQRLEAIPAKMEEIFAGDVLQLYADVVELTPVDTGFARNSWRIDLDRGTPTRAHIWNGASYIIYLEYGSSKQAPHGMLRISVERFLRDWRTVREAAFGG